MMLADLPQRCAVGVKRNAKGHQDSWIGYKLPIDTADGEIPISCVLTSASVHDSQVALPLATMTAVVTSLYDLRDSAYDVAAIKQHSRDLGHVPIIDTNPRATAGNGGGLRRVGVMRAPARVAGRADRARRRDGRVRRPAGECRGAAGKAGAADQS